MEGTIATIMMFAGNFAPKNWAFCAGQTISIASNTALFSLLGTTYGGDGRTAVMTNAELPNHPHASGPVHIGLTTAQPTTTSANTNLLASPTADTYATLGTTPTVNYGGLTADVGIAGSGQPFSIMNPYVGMNYVICQFGVFPYRP